MNQLAAILPSSIAAGTYKVTVTNNLGAISAPVSVAVVPHKPAIFTQNSSGSGLAVIQNYISASELDINRFTVGNVSSVPISPARPGQTLIAWLTGLGPITTGDNVAAPLLDVTVADNVQVIVGGMTITPSFAGRAPGLAGTDQVDFTLPANVPTGCAVLLEVLVNGVPSNATSVSIAPDQTSSACVYPGITTAQLQSLDHGVSVATGVIELLLGQSTTTIPGGGASGFTGIAVGSFYWFSGFQLPIQAPVTSAMTSAPVQTRACSVSDLGNTSDTPSPPSSSPSATTFSYLDAGNLTLSGPSGSGIMNLPMPKSDMNFYYAGFGVGESASAAPNAAFVPGLYSINGSGGKDIGTFNASINIGAPSISGGLPSTITRSSGLTLSWTGADPAATVSIAGQSETINGLTVSVAEFLCSTTAASGTFTVPASILNQIPASKLGFLTVSFGNPSTPFSAPLTSGGTTVNAQFFTSFGVSNTPVYQ